MSDSCLSLIPSLSVAKMRNLIVVISLALVVVLLSQKHLEASNTLLMGGDREADQSC